MSVMMRLEKENGGFYRYGNIWYLNVNECEGRISKESHTTLRIKHWVNKLRGIIVHSFKFPCDYNKHTVKLQLQFILLIHIHNLHN